jgi:uncharacterized lipoprotein NlpE involved in copper resistance
MVNKKIWLGMMALVLGLMVVGCDNGSTDAGFTVPESNVQVYTTQATGSYTDITARWRMLTSLT